MFDKVDLDPKRAFAASRVFPCKPDSGATCDVRHEIGLVVPTKNEYNMHGVLCPWCFVQMETSAVRMCRTCRDKAPHNGYADPSVLHDFGFWTKHPQTACSAGPCRVLERHNPRGAKSVSQSEKSRTQKQAGGIVRLCLTSKFRTLD